MFPQTSLHASPANTPEKEKPVKIKVPIEKNNFVTHFIYFNKDEAERFQSINSVL